MSMRCRVLGQGAVVVLISDRLERDAAGLPAQEMVRRHRSARRLLRMLADSGVSPPQSSAGRAIAAPCYRMTPQDLFWWCRSPPLRRPQRHRAGAGRFS